MVELRRRSGDSFTGFSPVVDVPQWGGGFTRWPRAPVAPDLALGW